THRPTGLIRAGSGRSAPGVNPVGRFPCSASAPPLAAERTSRRTPQSGGSAELTKAMGLEFDLTARGLGLRCQRFSMVVDHGVVTHVSVEDAGKFEVSSAEAMLAQL
ncbi:MAG: peroxiredoxin, partial [Betaproteobacteria bacterium]|nr:peroxiredoxin [Betaproteobacteria bacterium]